MALNSATSITCILFTLGLKKGDYLWTSSISFVASANCGVIVVQKVDLIDIDKDTFNLSIIDLKKN